MAGYFAVCLNRLLSRLFSNAALDWHKVIIGNIQSRWQIWKKIKRDEEWCSVVIILIIYVLLLGLLLGSPWSKETFNWTEPLNSWARLRQLKIETLGRRQHSRYIDSMQPGHKECEQARTPTYVSLLLVAARQTMHINTWSLQHGNAAVTGMANTYTDNFLNHKSFDYVFLSSGHELKLYYMLMNI